MREDLAAKIEELQESSPAFEDFDEPPRVRTFLDGLSAETDMPTHEDCPRWMPKSSSDFRNSVLRSLRST